MAIPRQLAVIEELWIDLVEVDQSSLRVAMAPKHAPKQEDFYIEIAASGSCIGFARMKFIAFMKCQAIYEATELHPANYRSQLSSLPLLPLSSFQLVTTLSDR